MIMLSNKGEQFWEQTNFLCFVMSLIFVFLKSQSVYIRTIQKQILVTVLMVILFLSLILFFLLISKILEGSAAHSRVS